MKCLLPISLALLAACGSDEPSSSPEPAADVTVASDATASDASSTDCPSGHIVGPDGDCMAVGIQGCDDMFIDPETGLCDPSLVDCPLGSIPIFGGEDQGCRPVGIQGCDDMFIDPETGLCDPAYVECPPGQIPVFSGDDQGCRAIGIVDCYPDFFDAETGRCDPQEDSCPEGSMAIPTQGCVSLDPPGGCGEGTWGNIEELPGDVHLDVNYAGDDSDGSREKPWTLYGYAVGQVQAGGRVVLAAGDYDQGMLVSKSISLVGRCSSMVTISGVRQGPSGPTVMEVVGNLNVTISDVTISGAARGLIAVLGAKLTLLRMRILDSQGTGLLGFHSGTEISLDTVEVSGTKPNAMQQLGDGIVMLEGAQLLASRAYVARNTRVGVFAHGLGSSVSLDETWITETQIGADGLMGDGVRAWSGGGVSVSRSLVSRNHNIGLAALGPSSSLTVRESQVSETLPDGKGQYGTGLVAQAGGSLAAERVRVSANSDTGAMVAEHASNLSLEESWISETMETQHPSAVGALVLLGGGLSLRRSVVSNNRGQGVALLDSGSTATISESWITGMPTNVPGIADLGLTVGDAAHATMSRSLVSGGHITGAMAYGEESSLQITEALIAGVRSDAIKQGGQGLQSSFGATVEVTRTALHGNQSVGLLAGSLGSRIIASEIWVFGNLPNNNGVGGFGLQANTGSEIELRRSVVEDNSEGGLLALDPWTSLTIEEVWVAGSTTTIENKGGYGVGVSLGATVSLRGVRLSGNHQQGLLVDSSATSALASEVSVSASTAFSEGKSGHGLVAQEGALLELSAAHVSGCFGAGVQFYSAEGSVSGSLLEGTGLGEQGTADGLLATESQLQVRDVISRMNARAGALFDKSGGGLTSSLLTENSIGLVNRGEPGLGVAEDSVIEGNDQDRLDGQGLEVPDEPLPLPTFAESP
ncbi:MAG: hypothetical protein CL940_07745 [Deltaproteobacteria bacterium]|nr:hypothetical protein [Deltaproteobacteria bacterium]